MSTVLLLLLLLVTLVVVVVYRGFGGVGEERAAAGVGRRQWKW